MGAESKTEKILKIVQAGGMLRARDFKLDPNSRRYLARLAEQGLIERIGRGIYTSTSGEISEHHTMAEASLRVPHGVICLLSALRFYDLTTEAPFATWIAIENKARTPHLDYPHLQVVRMSGASLTSGIEEHLIEGVRVRLYNPAKTVADCFKFRSRIGLDVALEALRDYRRKRIGSMDDLWKYAKICRVPRIIQPYLEAMG
jgi:predicted transcriptional regulator of viral defense system